MLLESYVPRCLIAQISAEARGTPAASEEFDGLVLFVDIVDSTGVTEKFARTGPEGAERLALILDTYFGGVMRLIDAYGGDTVRVDGDAVIALWRPQQPGDELSTLALRAAAAAEAVRDAYQHWRAEESFHLRHRLALLFGRLQIMLIPDGGGRRYFVLCGEPINRLGHPSLRGDADQILLGDEVARLLEHTAVLKPTPSGSMALLALNLQGKANPTVSDPDPPSIRDDQISQHLLRSLLPQVVVARSDYGRSDWLSEFRMLTAVYISLHGLDATASEVCARLESAVQAIRSTVHPLGAVIYNLAAGDKGFIVVVGFGLPPYAQERSASRALEAARRIPPALAAIHIGCSIGIATGLAFCGDIGNERRREYLTTGAVMVHATRLMQLADGSVLCDGATAHAAGNPVFLSDPELMHIKGRADPLPVHRFREAAPSFQSAVPRMGSAVFGRPDETRIFEELLSNLAATHANAGVAVIEAEAGAGKSHLLTWVAHRAATFGCNVLKAATSAIEKDTAYYAFREIVPQLLGADEVHAAQVQTLRARLQEILQGSDLRSKAALLEDILPLDFADKGLAPDIAGPARLAGIEALMTHLLEHRAADAPIVILIDDLHWIDGSSAVLLARLIERRLPLLAVLATRPPDAEVAQAVRDLLEAAQLRVRLPRLGPDAINQVVAERLGVAEIPQQLADFFYERSEGLPFFAEQLAFALRDSRILTVEEGRCHLTVDDRSEVTTPITLRDLIVSRIDRLLPNDQVTVKVASAIGRVFDTEMLERIHPALEAKASLRRSLAQLSAAGILSPVEGTEHETFTFRHVIIQGVTYDLLTYSQRRPLHRQIAQFLEERHRDVLSNHYAVLAEHWERAEEAQNAVTYRIGAADVASRRYANEDALRHVDRVERLAARFQIDLSRHTVAECARIRADALQELTRFSEANESYRKLAALHGIRMPGAPAALIAGLAVETASQALRRAGLVRTLASGAGKERDTLAAHIYMRCGEYAYFSNDTLVLAYSTLASLNRAERAQSLPEIVNASGGLALGLSAMGLDGWARFYRDRSIQLAATAGSQSSQGFAELLACVQSFHTADWPGMTLHGERGAEIWERLGDRYRHQCCLVLQAYCLVATGRYHEAESILLQFGEYGEEIESTQVRAWALAARAYLDVILARSPQSALTRLRRASAGDKLHRAEQLLCDGIAAAAHLQAQDLHSALAAAESCLDSMVRSSPAMAGALLLAVPCVAETLLVLAGQAGALGRSPDSLQTQAKSACDAARKFAANNRICRPRAALLLARLAVTKGGLSRPEAYCRKGLREARQLGLPLEHAISHLALGQVARTAGDRTIHKRRAEELFSQLGADSSFWELVWNRALPEPGTEPELQ
jgi:hypothetical protein